MESVKGNLIKVLAVIQSTMKKAVKNASNPCFKSKYATLENVNDVIQNAIEESKKQLVIQQFPKTVFLGENGEKEFIAVLTRITEPESMESEEFEMMCQPDKNNAQAMGSVITYLRRYSLVSYFNMSTEDDDGNEASGKTAGNTPQPQGSGTNRPPAQTSPKAQTPPKTNDARKTEGLIDSVQFDTLKNNLSKNKIDPKAWKAWLMLNFGVDSLGTIKAADYALILQVVSTRSEEINNILKKPEEDPLPPEPGI